MKVCTYKSKKILLALNLAITFTERKHSEMWSEGLEPDVSSADKKAITPAKLRIFVDLSQSVMRYGMSALQSATN